MSILITGGSGYIGSHTALELLTAGYPVVALDNLSNSSAESLKRVSKLAGKPCPLVKTDLLDKNELLRLFREYDIEGVIHFAGLKAVGESVKMPLLYYRNNVQGTLNLLAAMQESGVKNMVFSSSCTVYGNPDRIPVREDSPLSAASPYGRTKLMIEYMLKDLHTADPEWNVILLRYFNPVGAHKSGEIGEDPSGIPDNLMPYLAQVAIGKLDHLNVFGNDYQTRDGTGIRDYIHVVDLALGHIRAWEKLDEKPGVSVYNLGTGTGYSVLDMIRAFEEATGMKIPYRTVDRREGDIAEIYADPSKAVKELGWSAERDLQQMCRDTWNWQSKNPRGYRGK
ncbi:MAG: UDP-glucose 4-epimerase GalE [Balneolaceae bacterium]